MAISKCLVKENKSQIQGLVGSYLVRVYICEFDLFIFPEVEPAKSVLKGIKNII